MPTLLHLLKEVITAGARFGYDIPICIITPSTSFLPLGFSAIRVANTDRPLALGLNAEESEAVRVAPDGTLILNLDMLPIGPVKDDKAAELLCDAGIADPDLAKGLVNQLAQLGYSVIANRDLATLRAKIEELDRGAAT